MIIRSVPDTSVYDHSIGQTVTYERPISSAITLLINHGKRWALELDDIVAAQTDLPLLTKFTDDAAEQLKISIEYSFLNDSNIYNGMQSYMTGSACGRKTGLFNLGTSGSPISLTPTNVLDYIIDCGTVLDESLSPEVDRWMMVPPWVAGMIKKSDLKDASLTGDPKSPIRNGLIGSIDRFKIFSSNLLLYSGTSYYQILFGNPYAITFATQIVKTQHIPTPSDAFAERVRMLQVYGYQVIKPDQFGAMYVSKGA